MRIQRSLKLRNPGEAEGIQDSAGKPNWQEVAAENLRIGKEYFARQIETLTAAEVMKPISMKNPMPLLGMVTLEGEEADIEAVREYVTAQGIGTMSGTDLREVKFRASGDDAIEPPSQVAPQDPASEAPSARRLSDRNTSRDLSS